MKAKLLLFFFCLSVLSGMGQGTISRNKCKTCGKVISQCPHKGKHPKPAPKPEPKPKPKPKPEPKPEPKPDPKPVPKPEPEEAGYDVTFTCNVSSAALSIDGTSYGAVSSTRFLKTGTHTISLTAEGYENYTSTITVNRQNRSFHFAMTEKEELASYQNEVLHVGNVSYRMKYVSGGTFTMGVTSEMKKPYKDLKTKYDLTTYNIYNNSKKQYNDEEPTHQVTLSSYYIGETEVTQALWKAVMGSNPSGFIGDDLPVEMVSWDDCQTFISKLNALTGKRFRLPTEAEWEFAARGGNQSRHTQYSGSSRIDDVAWYRGNSGGKTHPVKTKQPNELGIYDMSGNVWEWCQDRYGSYSSYAQTNPTGASSGSDRVCRGGSWWDYPWECRSSIRSDNRPFYIFKGIGLRLVLSQ